MFNNYLKDIEMKKILYILIPAFLFGIVVFSVSSCKPDDDDDDNNPKTATPWEFPKGLIAWPTNVNVPEDNPMTVEGIELGRYLFYDGRLSGRSECDSQMSCATCHVQEYSFELGPNHPKFPNGHPHGIPDDEYPNGKPTPHVVLPLINLAYNFNGYLWNGMIHESNTNLGSAAYGVPAEPQYHMRNIESLVWMGIHAQHEINGSVEQTVELIQSIDIYPPMFEAAFGTREITYDRISKAIAQFIRSIIANNTKFHQWIRKEIPNLAPQEYRGYQLFMSESADCFHCHGETALLTTNEFYNNGKDTLFGDDPRDRYAFTKDPLDQGAYKATTLINIELTGPYMHDGRFKTLREVIDFYSEGVHYSPYVDPLMEWVHYGGVQLTESEKDDLMAFLKTLTDYELLSNPAYARPSDLDTGCK
jgi:cytochrome c peroxidase